VLPLHPMSQGLKLLAVPATGMKHASHSSPLWMTGGHVDGAHCCVYIIGACLGTAWLRGWAAKAAAAGCWCTIPWQVSTSRAGLIALHHKEAIASRCR
jgi:hypothetical protein